MTEEEKLEEKVKRFDYFQFDERSEFNLKHLHPDEIDPNVSRNFELTSDSEHKATVLTLDPDFRT